MFRLFRDKAMSNRLLGQHTYRSSSFMVPTRSCCGSKCESDCLGLRRADLIRNVGPEQLNEGIVGTFVLLIDLPCAQTADG